MKVKVYVAKATHFHVPGLHQQISVSEAEARKFAASRLRIIYADLMDSYGDAEWLQSSGFKPFPIGDITAENWGEVWKILEKHFVDYLDSCDVWIEEEEIVDMEQID